MWSFQPVTSFEDRREKAAYRSVEWSLIAALPIFAGYTWRLVFQLEVPNPLVHNVPLLVVAVLHVILSTTVFTHWLRTGVDLHQDRKSLAVLAIPLLAALILLPATGNASHALAALTAVSVSTLSLIFALGPSWLGIIPTGLMAGFGFAVGTSNIAIASFAGYGLLYWLTCKSSVWYLSVFRIMEEVARTKTQIRLAEERVRFAADLHDIMGQRLAAISLHTQIARQLAIRGKDVSETLERIAEINDQSTRDLKQIITEYDEPDVRVELTGAVSLLEAVGAEVTVRGHVPDAFAVTAGYVIREATTNILKHAEAREVRIELNEHGMRVTNDGAGFESAAAGTGLRALARRIVPANLTWEHNGDVFDIQVRWDRD